jgi:lysophospholipase L1-like esterase
MAASTSMSKRARVVTTILCICSVAAVMLIMLGRLSRNSTTPTTMVANAAHTPAARTLQRTHRILAYGDSLTAGTSGFQQFPYAVYLERALQTRENVVVRYRGMPGWTVQAMLGDLDGDRTGLRSAIQAVQNPPLSLVILLAGTNDLGLGSTAEEITENLVQLHQVCFDNGVTRTIAVGVPPSGYQARDKNAAALAATVNRNLQQYSALSVEQQEQPGIKKTSTTYVTFPFEFERDGENWFADTLHFSEKGYQVLGESLAPVVERILQSLDDELQNEAS